MKTHRLEKLKENYWLHFALLLAAAALFAGKPVPFSNEFVYLLRLIKPYHPDFLLNDFTFSIPANEHWLFNHLFGLFTYFVSIEVIAWIGRIACWMALLAGLLRLGKLWKIPLLMISAAIFLWLCLGQSIVADEWMIGGFEAKCVAYICLLFGLEGFGREKKYYPAVLLGLSFSFHPAVGLWAIPATLAALFAVRRDLKSIAINSMIIGVFSLFGLVSLISSQVSENLNTVANWRFYDLIVFPNHMDPFLWERPAIFLMLLIMVFCIMLYIRNIEDSQLKFITVFLAALSLFFVGGIALRALEMFDLLRFMPMRLYAVFAPLFLMFALAKAFQQRVFAPPVTWIMVIALTCVLAWSSPIWTGYSRILTTYRAWAAETDDAAKSFVWVRNNTPNGTIVLAPPWQKNFWYLSQRAQVVSFGHIPISHLNEWQSRLVEFAGESSSGINEVRLAEMKTFYNHLTPEQVAAAEEKYGAAYFISESDYAFQVAFQSGNVKVYRLRPID